MLLTKIAQIITINFLTALNIFENFPGPLQLLETLYHMVFWTL